MILTMEICDFKSLSLQLYGKEVEITLNENSSTHKLYDTIHLKGTLIGRLWGDRLTQGKHEETVIALTIQDGNNEIEIPCRDIQCLQRSRAGESRQG
jgi:hypothetical protein